MAILNGQPVQPINGVVSGTDGDDTIIAEATDSGITLGGGPGLDTLQSSGTNNTLLGDLGNDSLESLAGADNTTMDGGSGDDFLVGGGMNDTASYASAPAGVGVTVDLSAITASDGFGGTDTLLGIENVTGSANADSLTGDGEANVLQGGAGNDTLTGNGGADVFKYSFNLTQGGGGETFRFTDWLSDKYGRDFGDELPDFSPKHHQHHHKHGQNDEHRGDDGHHSKGDHCGDDRHHPQDAGLTEKFFEKNYAEWLKEVVVPDLLEQGFVLDANGNGKIKIDINEDSRNGTPRIEGLTKDQLAEIFGDRDSVILNDGGKTEKAWYSNSYTSPGGGQDGIAGNDGFDTIVDFTFGEDKLEFNGLGADFTVDQFTSLFVATEADVNGDSTIDTVLALADGTWGVTLLDVSGHTEADFHATSVFS